MSADQQAWTEADAQSFDQKWQAFVATLTPAEEALLEERLNGGEDDVQGYSNTDPRPTIGPPPSAARPRPRPGSSAQPPR